jgi:hypothetical protein
MVSEIASSRKNEFSFHEIFHCGCLFGGKIDPYQAFTGWHFLTKLA